MNYSQFAVYSLVIHQHAYYMSLIGHALRRKRMKESDMAGIKAKGWAEGNP